MIDLLKKSAIAGAVALACLQPAVTSAQGDSRVEIGVLNCVVSGGSVDHALFARVIGQTAH